jgi:hypothetical protein
MSSLMVSKRVEETQGTICWALQYIGDTTPMSKRIGIGQKRNQAGASSIIML